MKKTTLLLGLLCLVSAANVSAKGKNALSVRSGDFSVLREPSTALFEIDYSAATADDLPLDEYLKQKGGNLERDFYTKIKDQCVFQFIYIFKKNKGLQTPKDATEAPYKIVVHVNTLYMGGGAGALLGIVGGATALASQKAGGITLSGTIDIVDTATGETVCTIGVDELKAHSGINVQARLYMLYCDLAKQMRKMKQP